MNMLETSKLQGSHLYNEEKIFEVSKLRNMCL